MKAFKPVLSVLLVLCLIFSMVPAYAAQPSREKTDARGIHNGIIIDDDATGGYEGDYVVIYNPSTSASSSYSTGNMTGLIETSVNANVQTDPAAHRAPNTDMPIYKIDIDSQLKELAETVEPGPEPEPTRASFKVGDTKTFRILAQYSPTGSSSMTFECLYVGEHCYIWTPTSSANNTYPLDEIDTSFAQMAASEFDSKFDLMQSSFGNHTNGSSGDGKLHMLYYNINEGWNGSGGYVAGFFYQVDISNNGLPILNIDTYPGVYYKNPNSGNEYKRMDDTYGTMVHEYQHLINYSNTSNMSTWLNECFSAAAEEICYPGSSVVGRIQSWENYYYSDNNDWLNPPAEFQYQSDFNLHNGFSMYNWDNNIDDILALYSQVSFFAQYLYTRFGNTIYRQISNKYSSSETTAITNATGVSCADLVRDFRVAVTANATQDQYGGVYGFKAQEGYDPAKYNNVQNPWDLLSPVIFTGSSCSIKGGGAITVKPVNGVYNPPSGASANLKYIGIKLASPYTITAVSNNDAWGTVSVSGTRITAAPADGYYVSGYEVTEGTATAVIDGNIITVTPESDCTIRVIFAPKPTYTVNFVVCGNAEGSQSALVNDTITLPSAVSTNPDGWTFTGWTNAELPEETADKPAYYAPGAEYTVTGNTTLYAVYTRVEEGTGAPVYELISTAPSDWAGNYVITYGTNTGMYVMKGVTPGSNGAQIENAANAASYAASGVTLTDTTLTNVANDYLFTLSPHGSYYSIQSVSTGTYLGMDSSSYLSGYTTYTSGNCDWTPGSKTNASTATNAKNGSYPLISFNTSNNYFWSGNPNNTAALAVRFWKENPGSTTYYTTSPAAAHEHTPAAAVEENRVEPTCTEPGSYDLVVYCTVCGEEISRQTVTIPATGHDWGTPTYEWAADNSTVTAKRVCANDPAHVETETVNTTVETTDATCEAAGQTVYTATFENEAFEAQTKTVTIPATGHAYGEPTYEWAADNSTVTAKRVCANNPAHIETETVNTTAVTTDATCEAAGQTVYTATFENEAFETQTKTVTIPATGHDWGTPTYEWAADNSTVTATVVCANDESHVITETVNTTYVVVTEPTTETEGLGRYTAEFENALFETQTKDVVIDKLPIQGYHIIVTDKTNGAASTSIDADALYSGDVTFTVTCAKACVVAIVNGDDTYTKLACTTENGEHKFTVTVTDADVKIVVAIKGDVNLDGKISTMDATMAKQKYLGTATFAIDANLQMLTADVSGDNKITTMDATMIKQAYLGTATLSW